MSTITTPFHAYDWRIDKCQTRRSGTREDNPGRHLETILAHRTKPHLPMTATLLLVVPARLGGRALTLLDPPKRYQQTGERPYLSSAQHTSPIACDGKHLQGRWAGRGGDPSSVQWSMRGRREPGDPGREGKGPCSP
ncbi:hypothetical protein JB92DRAFT_2832419 [Gautieria morchelliformis]|nr:hypothetical protein JB92DRAFT_2832419 [Gautieria morchelliformis]